MATIPNQDKDRPNFYLAWIMALSFSVDFRLKIGLDFELSELILLVLVGATVMVKGVSCFKPWQILVAVIWLCVFLICLSVSDRHDKTVTAFRNISFGMLMLFTIIANSFSNRQKITLFKVFVIGGVLTSILGLHQAIYGFDHSFTLIDYEAIREQARQSRGIDVFTWKLKNINSGSLSVGQSALSIGLYTFSNNFGEFLVYVTIALCGLRRSLSISTIVFTITLLLILTAIFLSQSRSSLIGAVIVVAYHLFKSLRGIGSRTAFAILAFVLIASVVPYVVSSFGYDGFKTVQGRGELDAGSIIAFTASPTSLLFGGNLKTFYDGFAQDPHNMILYICMLFGIPFAIVFLGVLIGITGALYFKSRVLLDPTARAIVESGFAVSVWFIGYGMTWSVVNVALSDLMWAFFIGSALSVRGVQRPLSNDQSVSSGVLTTSFRAKSQ